MLPSGSNRASRSRASSPVTVFRQARMVWARAWAKTRAASKPIPLFAPVHDDDAASEIGDIRSRPGIPVPVLHRTSTILETVAVGA